jgi:hypothetical protein
MDPATIQSKNLFTALIRKQCCGSGMFYPGSRIRIPNFFIPDPGGEKAPDPGSRILLYIKIGMKLKPTFFLLFIVSGASFIGKKFKNKDS